MVKKRLRPGRPAGLTKQPWWKQQGRKPKERQELPIGANTIAEDDGSDSESEDDVLEDGEEVLSYTIQVSRKEAMSGPDSVRWLEADNAERLQLEALQCWRPLRQDELQPGDEIIPGVVIYTRKRCGKLKCRMVALGNLQRCSAPAEIFSPTVSHASTRALLVRAASMGHPIGQFDISNAFIRSSLRDEDRIFLRLPRHWSKDSRGDVVRLLRSLYGLRCAPRRWYDTYSSFLLKTGWERCPEDPGLFRRGEVFIACYVDDTFVSAPTQDLVDSTMEEILNEFDGKIIEAVDGVRDVLGVRLTHDKDKKYMKLDLQEAIVKLAKQFNVSPDRKIGTPCVYSDLSEGQVVEYPIRSMVGGLQYIATTARPDVLYAVNRVSRHMTKCTSAVVTAAKRIVRYLLHTQTTGIEYSVEREKAFRETYQKVLQEHGKGVNLGDCVAFSDADFAGCSVTFKSHSKSILCHKGCPVLWSSRRHSCEKYL